MPCISSLGANLCAMAVRNSVTSDDFAETSAVGMALGAAGAAVERAEEAWACAATDAIPTDSATAMPMTRSDFLCLGPMIFMACPHCVV